MLVVLAPRALLAAAAAARARRLARALPLDTSAGYFGRLLRSGRGASVHAAVLPYSHAPDAPRAERLKALLHDVLGARAHVTLEEPLSYGGERVAQEHPPEGATDEAWSVLLFNLAQTPESEVHGRLLEELRRESRGERRGLVIVDAAAWRERAADAPALERRLAEKRRAWDRVARDVGLEVVHLDLDEPPTDELLERIEGAVWPPRAAEVAG